MTTSYGMAFHRTEPAASVIARAKAAEQQGFDEFWVIEDCFFTAGVSLAAAALTATSSITVGIGIMPVVARNAAMTAMEIATLAELAPGRFHAGLGHGVQEWMAQMGAKPDSPLTALEETFNAVGSLLDGEEVTTGGRYVTLDKVALNPAPSVRPLLSAGVRGPKSMAAASRCADGVILADFVSAEYVRWVREQLGEGDHRITVFAALAAGPHEALPFIREGLGGHLAEVAAQAPISLVMAPFFEELKAQADASNWHEAVAAMPDEWLTQIAPYGSAETAAGYVDSMIEAGADAIAFFPGPDSALEDGRWAAAHLLPALAR